MCVPARHLGRVHGYFWLLESPRSVDRNLWPEAVVIADTAASLLNLVEHRQARRDGLYREVVEGPSHLARRSAIELAAAAGTDVRSAVACVLVHRPDLAEQIASRPARRGVVWAREDDVAAAVVRAELLESAADLAGLLH